MYGATPEQYMRRQSISGWLWGAVLPVGAIAAAGITHGITLAFFAAYGLLLFKIYQHCQAQGEGQKKSFLYAFFCTISKVPQAIGQAKYWVNRWQQEPATLIEYKG